MQIKRARGSVSRCLRYGRKYETNKEFREKVLEQCRINNKKRKIRINNRCMDCKKLISANAKRCQRCSIINNHESYLKRR